MGQGRAGGRTLPHTIGWYRGEAEGQKGLGGVKLNQSGNTVWSDLMGHGRGNLGGERGQGQTRGASGGGWWVGCRLLRRGARTVATPHWCAVLHSRTVPNAPRGGAAGGWPGRAASGVGSPAQMSPPAVAAAASSTQVGGSWSPKKPCSSASSAVMRWLGSYSISREMRSGQGRRRLDLVA